MERAPHYSPSSSEARDHAVSGRDTRFCPGAWGVLVLSAVLVVLFCLPCEGKGVKKTGDAVRLFGTVEFKGSLKALPNWLKVLKAVQGDPTLKPSASLSRRQKEKAERQWKALRRKAKKQTRLETMKTVNMFFNTFPYRLDRENYGTSDYWANPDEFVRHSGDCEDYSIIKYYALKELGFSRDQLRIVVLTDSIRGIGHAVLAVYADGTAYILDNVTDMVLPHTKFTHYLPQYSVNERTRWAHIPPAQ